MAHVRRLHRQCWKPCRIFDLSTQLYPAYFLPLASLGNLAKATARGLKDPSFQVIQNHFAVAGNLGEVAAKDTPGVAKSFPVLASTWVSMRLIHLWFRYQSLSVLQFTTINLKRARILAKSHVLHASVPGYMVCNQEESILSWQRFLKPRIIFGASLEEMLGSKGSSLKLMTLLKLYAMESYVLTVHKLPNGGLKVLVSFKQGATGSSALRSIWQSYWIYKNWNSSENVMKLTEQSLLHVTEGFDDFTRQLEAAGWDTNQITLKVPKEPYIEQPVTH